MMATQDLTFSARRVEVSPIDRQSVFVEVMGADLGDLYGEIDVADFVDHYESEVFDAVDVERFLKYHGIERKEED